LGWLMQLSILFSERLRSWGSGNVPIPHTIVFLADPAARQAQGNHEATRSHIIQYGPGRCAREQAGRDQKPKSERQVQKMQWPGHLGPRAAFRKDPCWRVAEIAVSANDISTLAGVSTLTWRMALY
jgi:hypothetical protein